MTVCMTKINCSFFVVDCYIDWSTMSHLYISDIFKIFHNFEASRLKLWEIVRTYDPIEFAQFLYLLDNITKFSRRECVELDETMLRDFCQYYIDGDDSTDEQSKPNYTITIDSSPTLRLERVTTANGDIFWNDTVHNDTFCLADPKTFKRHPMDVTISSVMTNIRTKNAQNIDNPYERILQHNLGTKYYGNFILKIQYCLFMDSLQTDRNEINSSNQSSIVTNFLEFYSILQRKQFQDGDPRNLRFLIVPPPKRIMDINEINKRDYIVQPLYQGFHVVIYSSDTETKAYNRFGELHQQLAYSMRTTKNCTFEAIVLPMDSNDNVRSWRYWPYRKKILIYIVDVYRMEQTILTNVPFCERIKYIDAIEQITTANQSVILRKIPKTLGDWSSIETKYIKNRDIFDPIVGVVLRKPTDTLKTPSLAYKFNVTCCFDLLRSEIVDVPNVNVLKQLHIQQMHINFEMADYRTTCVAYGHCNRFIYLCEYDRNIHQFVHFARIHRLPYEFDEPTYRPENVYIVNHQTTPQGLLYLRVYYDVSFKILGYDVKLTDCRYNVPYTNPLFNSLKNKNMMLLET